MKPRKVVSRALKTVKTWCSDGLDSSGLLEARVFAFDDLGHVVVEAPVAFDARGPVVGDDDYARSAEVSLEQVDGLLAATRVDVGMPRILVWRAGERVAVTSEALIVEGQIEAWSETARGLEVRELRGVQAGLVEAKGSGDQVKRWSVDVKVREAVTARLDSSLSRATEALNDRVPRMDSLETFENFYVDGTLPRGRARPLQVLSPLPLNRVFAVSKKLLRRAGVRVGTIGYSVPRDSGSERVYLVTVDLPSGEVLLGTAEIVRLPGAVRLREADLSTLPAQAKPVDDLRWPELSLDLAGLISPGASGDLSDERLRLLEQHGQATLEALLMRSSHPELEIQGFTVYLDGDGDALSLPGLPDQSVERWLDVRAALALEPTSHWMASRQVLALHYWDGDGAHMQTGVVVEREPGRPGALIHWGDWAAVAP